MEKLKVDIENCFGIKKLDEEFSFTDCNAHSIYAKNGLMKTSLAKVFKKIQDNKHSEIKDLIFDNNIPRINISIDDDENISDKIFVINSFENTYESESISSLLVNDEIKSIINELIKSRENLLKELVKVSGIKISSISAGKKIYILEDTIINDFAFENKSIIENIESFNLTAFEYDYSNIDYSVLFDKTNIKTIKSDSFQSNIEAYLNKVDEIYSHYNFLGKGAFTLPKMIDIHKRLKSSYFYDKENKIILEGIDTSLDENELQTKIDEILNLISETDELKALEKQLSNSKGVQLKDLIENNQEIITELRIENLDHFKRKIWLSYFKKFEARFNDLRSKYLELKDRINEIDKDDTPWQNALSIFNNRFSLPFKMEIDNLMSSIIGESVPKVIFSFNINNDLEDNNQSNWKKINRTELDNINVLSQGEKRALFLLNIIFDIEERRRKNQETIFIIDDIADSFDYKNKYAIVEYLNDIVKIDHFKIIFLSHNFDFYRTVSKRLNISRDNRLTAQIEDDEIKIIKEKYQDKPFEHWKEILKSRNRYNVAYSVNDAKKHIIALIPFVRNLIEFGVDKNKSQAEGFNKDYKVLTSLLHVKDRTNSISIRNLKLIYNEYIGKDDFDPSIQNDTLAISLIDETVEYVHSENSSDLENKIILAIGIRLNAERYMIDKINNEEFVNSINGVQTRALYNKYAEMFQTDNNILKLLESVNILTPENIHLNSFMYEPILDMDVIELKNLYTRIKSL